MRGRSSGNRCGEVKEGSEGEAGIAVTYVALSVPAIANGTKRAARGFLKKTRRNVRGMGLCGD
jgi:hypothetical protein